ncbi:hypothetical protein ABIB66_006001 [Bradyrhizobium sp. F1.13.3]
MMMGTRAKQRCVAPISNKAAMKRPPLGPSGRSVPPRHRGTPMRKSVAPSTSIMSPEWSRLHRWPPHRCHAGPQRPWAARYVVFSYQWAWGDAQIVPSSSWDMVAPLKLPDRSIGVEIWDDILESCDPVMNGGNFLKLIVADWADAVLSATTIWRRRTFSWKAASHVRGDISSAVRRRRGLDAAIHC